MAVIRCPHCNQYISSLVSECTECGKPIRVETSQTKEEVPAVGKVEEEAEEVEVENVNEVEEEEFQVETETLEPPVNQKTPEIPDGQKQDESPVTPHVPRAPRRKWYQFTLRRFVVLCFVLPFIIFFVVIAIGDCSRSRQLEERAYERLANCNDLQWYEDFMIRFPQSEHMPDVRKRYEALKVELAAFYSEAAQGDQDALREFLAKHPNSPYRKNCEMRLDSLDWQDAVAANTLEAFQTYISQHPQGIFLSDANDARNRQARMVVTAEESSLIRSTLDGFLSAMTTRDAERIDEISRGRFSFCGMADAEGANVVEYYNQNMHKEDVLGIHFQVGGLAISKKGEGSSDRMNYYVNASATATINRSSLDSAMVINYRLSASFTPDRTLSGISLEEIVQEESGAEN